MRSMVRPRQLGPTAMVTAAGSRTRALLSPRAAFTAAAMREAVVKSGSRRMRTTSSRGGMPGASFSTRAPPGMRPAVGWFFFEVEPDPPSAAKPPMTSEPWASA